MQITYSRQQRGVSKDDEGLSGNYLGGSLYRWQRR